LGGWERLRARAKRDNCGSLRDDDERTSNGKDEDEMRGSFTAFRMTVLGEWFRMIVLGNGSGSML
jgi:hypothetical protein